MLPSAVVVAQEKGFERQHPFEPWPLAAASRPPVEVMPSRSYLLKQWPTRPYQEDGAQLSSTALLASSSANDNDRAPSHDFPRRTAAVDLRIRPVRYQHPLRESVGRPPDAGRSPTADGCALDIYPSKRVRIPPSPPAPPIGGAAFGSASGTHSPLRGSKRARIPPSLSAENPMQAKMDHVAEGGNPIVLASSRKTNAWQCPSMHSGCTEKHPNGSAQMRLVLAARAERRRRSAISPADGRIRASARCALPSSRTFHARRPREESTKSTGKSAARTSGTDRGARQGEKIVGRDSRAPR
jgi:hypothetical protein